MARNRTVLVIFAVLALAGGTAAVADPGAGRGPGSDAASPGTAAPAGAARMTSAAQGFVLQGVRLARPGGRCDGTTYEIRSAGRLLGCTHGPDVAPDGVDVAARQSVAALRARTAPTPPGVATTPCIGNGSTGMRVQAIYAYQQGKTNRINTIGPLIRTWAGEINAAYDASAAETGGSRQVPFLTNAQCVLTVTAVALPAAALGFDFGATVDALHDKGFNKENRKYLVWADVNKFCGIGQVIPDDSPGADNQNNQTTPNPFSKGMTARIDNACWGLASSTGDPVEAHELTHTMGSVQDSAPRHSQNGHCTDEWDAMCYHDASGTTLKFTCPVQHDLLLDCGHNDYFSTKPPAGSYLAKHWNTADNVFQVDDLAPANDAFARALPVDAGPGTYVGNTLLATPEDGEPDLPGVSAEGAHSIWFRMKAPGAKTLSVDTQGSSFDTLVGVYRGANLGSLTVVATNDNAKTGQTYSRVTAPTTANTTYWIRVDGKAGKRGSVMLHAGYGDTTPVIDSVSPLQVKPGVTKVTVTGQDLVPPGVGFQITVNGMQIDYQSLTTTFDGTKVTFKVLATTYDPDTVHYTPGMTGPVVIWTEDGVTMSDQQVKLTA